MQNSPAIQALKGEAPQVNNSSCDVRVNILDAGVADTELNEILLNTASDVTTHHNAQLLGQDEQQVKQPLRKDNIQVLSFCCVIITLLITTVGVCYRFYPPYCPVRIVDRR